jgi:hypothetical protein
MFRTHSIRFAVLTLVTAGMVFVGAVAEAKRPKKTPKGKIGVIKSSQENDSFVHKPSNVRATATDTSVRLSWTDNSNAEAGFTVIYRPDGVAYDYGDEPFDVPANTERYDHGSLEPGSTHFYNVCAVASSGTRYCAVSGLSQNEWVKVSTTEQPPAPSAPDNLQVEFLPHSTTNFDNFVKARLSWSPGSNAHGYQISIDSDGVTYCENEWSFCRHEVGSGTTSIDTPRLRQKTALQFRVCSLMENGAHQTSGCAQVNTATPDLPGPSAPANIQARVESNSNGRSQVRISWVDMSGNEQGFYVRRYTDSECNIGGLGKEIRKVNANSTFVDDSLLWCSTAYYQICAYNHDLGDYTDDTPCVPETNASGAEACLARVEALDPIVTTPPPEDLAEPAVLSAVQASALAAYVQTDGYYLRGYDSTHVPAETMAACAVAAFMRKAPSAEWNRITRACSVNTETRASAFSTAYQASSSHVYLELQGVQPVVEKEDPIRRDPYDDPRLDSSSSDPFVRR